VITDLYSSPSIIWVILLRTRWADYVADMERGEVHMGVGLGILRREKWGDVDIAGWIVEWIFKNRIGRACRLN
jgi:hypothetical protein